MARYLYSASIESFLAQPQDLVVGAIHAAAREAQLAQNLAWVEEVSLLQSSLPEFSGRGDIYFEFAVPRIGKRVDVVLRIDGIVFVVEFKVGERAFHSSAIEQVWDYALDLNNFHETSHNVVLAPILVATRAHAQPVEVSRSAVGDSVLRPILIGPAQIGFAIGKVLEVERSQLAHGHWHAGRYRPTPTIIEAAKALFSGHSVEEIATRGAEAKNLGETSQAVVDLVHEAKRRSRKVICFVTGVPGAGKTLVGLNVSTTNFSSEEGRAVYLSGNGPLVKVLQEALALDAVARSKDDGKRSTKSDARRAVSAFIQNVHHFRDAYLDDLTAPDNHVAIFDESQRAWTQEETARFMREKKGRPDFEMSEPAFLISCMDRHDWAVIVCLVGGGQEINRGEAGISGWIEALLTRFLHWDVAISPELSDSEYGAAEALAALKVRAGFSEHRSLHLSTSLRSFRAAGVSSFVKALLDLDREAAHASIRTMGDRYPMVLTRSLARGKEWVRTQARGSERFGLMVSSQAQRLRPLAIDVRVATDPVHWFLKGKDDVRSSFFLEAAATEFDVQGLEVDWSCVVWDGDLRMSANGWQHSSFKGNRWERINKSDRQTYLRNAYRVLLTRARQGMAIVVPEGDTGDPTRQPVYYDETYEYLLSLGLRTL